MMSSNMASFKVEAERKANEVRTNLVVHGKVIASSEWRPLLSDKTYEMCFGVVKVMIEK